MLYIRIPLSTYDVADPTSDDRLGNSASHQHHIICLVPFNLPIGLSIMEAEDLLKPLPLPQFAYIHALN